MPQPKDIIIFVASPAYCYKEEKNIFTDMMLERHLDQLFIADSYGEAVQQSLEYTLNRYEQYFKDAYNECFIGSLKVFTKLIGRQLPDKRFATVSGGCFFEWKYDWPDSLERYVAAYLKKEESKEHPSE